MDAQKFIKRNRCARCWGHLHEIYRDGKWTIECRQGGQKHIGFVTEKWVESQIQKDHSDYREARDLLEKLGILEKPPRKSAKQILEELGF